MSIDVLLVFLVLDLLYVHIVCGVLCDSNPICKQCSLCVCTPLHVTCFDDLECPGLGAVITSKVVLSIKEHI